MATREVCETARAFRLPLLYDVAGQAYVMDMLAPQFPDVNFIIPHLGSFADDWRVHQQVVDLMVRFPNVYGDTSGVRRFDYIVQAVNRAGAQKLLFGSDGPWLHPGLELHKIRLLQLPPDKEDLILGGNTLRLLRQVRADADGSDLAGTVNRIKNPIQPRRRRNQSPFFFNECRPRDLDDAVGPHARPSAPRNQIGRDPHAGRFAAGMCVFQHPSRHYPR
jgi:hypothetical protein